MTASDPITAKIRAGGRPSAPGRARGLARRALWRVAPAYARRRSRRIATASSLERLAAEFEQLRKRHTEQIERLEDLVRELVLTAETLRRDLGGDERRDEA
ncbi:MAG TPA: hypothetical protein VN672_06040 [Solirubrobacteraceae bacterium]|nr:hypothetical protein [Solirubrobacteraceae bacterium]